MGDVGAAENGVCVTQGHQSYLSYQKVIFQVGRKLADLAYGRWGASAMMSPP